MKKIFTLGSYDFIKGLVVFVIAAVLTYVLGIINAPGFDLATFDWHQILTVALTSGISYLVKNFGTTSQGKLVGAVQIEKPV